MCESYILPMHYHHKKAHYFQSGAPIKIINAVRGTHVWYCELLLFDM